MGKMRKVEVDISELIDAFTNSRIENEYYLDAASGELLHISDEWMDSEEVDKIYEQIEQEPDRYVAIPADGPQNGYRDMRAFAEAVENENLREKLQIALEGEGAFRRFKNVLLEYPEKREEWFKFKEERTKSRIADWAEGNRIELVEKKYD